MGVRRLPDGTVVRDGADAYLDPKTYNVGPTTGWDGEVGTGATKKNKLYDVGIPLAVGSIFAAGPFVQGGAAAAGAGASGTASTAVPSMPWTIPASVQAEMPGVISGVDLGAAGVGGVEHAVTQALTKAGVAPSIIQSLLKNPQTYAGLAALLPSLTGGFGGGGNSPFSGDTAGLMQEAKDALALQNKRVQQAQPVYDTLVNMAYGSSPMHYRGAAPAGYTPNEAPQGGYAYQAPRFGKNG